MLQSESSTGNGNLPRLPIRTHLPSLLSFTQRVILHPASVYMWLYPPAPEAPAPPRGGSGGRGRGRGDAVPPGKMRELEERPKPEPEEESEDDRHARYRISAMGAVKWLLSRFAVASSYHPPYSIGFLAVSIPPSHSVGSDAGEALPLQPATLVTSFLSALLSDSLFLSSLYNGQHAPWLLDDAGTSFGFRQPVLRRSAWSMLQPLTRSWLGKPFSPLTIFLDLINLVFYRCLAAERFRTVLVSLAILLG